MQWARKHPFAIFPGICRVHRAVVLKRRGSLAEAEREALRASQELIGSHVGNSAAAYAEVGDIRRFTHPRELMAYLGRSSGNAGSVPSRVSDGEDAFLEIFAHLRQHTRHDLSRYKRSTVARRVDRRMVTDGLNVGLTGAW